MLSADEIKKTITELENGDTNFVNCQKLASLYIVLDHYNAHTESTHKSDDVTNELNDILPALKEYQQAKTEFLQHRITQEGVNHFLQRLVVEINEFITVLYSNTTAPEEREILKNIKAFEN